MPWPGVDPSWSRTVIAPDASGAQRSWHVLDNGAEPTEGTLLCVHGNPTWSYLWRRLLGSAPPGWRVLAPDQLGMGWSERLDSPRRLADRVDDLSCLMEALGVTGPVVTVGHDWGGVVSLGWAVRHRRQVRGLVLCNTAVAQPPGDRGPFLIRLAHVPLLREIGCVQTPVFVRATAALSSPALPPEVRRALGAPYRSARRRRAVGDFVADIPFAGEHPSRPALEAVADGIRSLDVPALLLWGPRDPVFGEKYLADLRDRLPQAQLHRYEGASHLLPEDAPQYAEAVARWVVDEGLGDGTRPGGTRTPLSDPVEPAEVGTAGRDLLWSALERRADDLEPAVVELGGATLSWQQLHSRVRDLAAGLAASGVRPGDRVALLVPPSAELTAAVYAVWRAGAVVVVVDRGLGFTGMRRALRGAAVDHVIGGAVGLAAARAMGLPGTRIAVSSLDRIAATGRGLPPPPEPSPDQECAVLFTSGATGPAKGVVYRHRHAAAQLALLRSTYELGAGDRLVAAFAPFALLAPALGLGSAVPAIDVTEPGKLTASQLADAVAAVRATIVFASPAALRNVAATSDGLGEQQLDALAGVRLVMSAGAPVPARLLRSLTGILPGAELHTPYGMTEALPVTDVSLDEIVAAGAGNGVYVGRPAPSVEVAISPLTDTGTPEGRLTDAAGVTGEICVRGEHVKDRYDSLWATERASREGVDWHRTGDVGHLDADGGLRVEGRLAHVIVTPGGVVTPVGVEQRVEELPGLVAAAAVGVGPGGNQVVVVVAVPAQPRGPRRKRRLRLASSSLADQVRSVARVPVAAVLVTGRLPVDIRHQSKVDRLELAARAAALLSGG
ncbi:MAG: cis-3-alkyl-4-acyloxetan-2-one decarboxylase / olefin beta-lactone synthetase [Nocardioidaceae bacterium]|nr:cis-3-alkyl-4-acyloxetan-2-one decarboxylase / olefin beta-lactone synthetase [Nocardioidaceae bacterium]